MPVQQPSDFVSQPQLNMQQRDPVQLYSMPTILPNLAIPPLFSGTMATEYASTANATGASVLAPEMTWSRVDLPPFIWFELYVRAGAVLSAAAVARESPEGAFFGWQGQVGVVAPDLMWEALRESLAKSIPFSQPSVVEQSNHYPHSANDAPASPSLSAKPASTASTNWGNSENQAPPADVVAPSHQASDLTQTVNTTPNQTALVGGSAKSTQKQAHQRPMSSQSSHSREADASAFGVSRKSSNNSLAHHTVFMVPNPTARPRQNFSTQRPNTAVGTKLYALDAMEVPIPALAHLPQQFLKDMDEAFGGVRAFCYHVTKSQSGRVCVAQRGDGDVKEICEKHGVEFGQIVSFEEAARVASAKVGSGSAAAREDQSPALSSRANANSPEENPTTSSAGDQSFNKQQRSYQHRSQQFRPVDGVPRSDGSQQHQPQQWQHQHHGYRGGSGGRGITFSGRGRGRFDGSGGTVRGGRGRGAGSNASGDTKEASLQSATPAPTAVVSAAQSTGSS
ncbi:hypothetical protein HDU82_002308 [Entophlyctis luteolus]|nr:hypothetical protein HDU82_002308 [Entophlyctis luteolus]